MPPIEERDCPTPSGYAELLAYYRELYPRLKRNCDTAWKAAYRMRRQRNRWQMVAAAEAALMLAGLVIWLAGWLT